MNRFDRDYKLTIITPNIEIVVLPPLNISFTAEKSINSYGLNRLSLRVFNLDTAKRNQLVKDAEEEKVINVILEIGYKGELRQIFKGNIYKAYPEKSGADLISVMDCLDGFIDTKYSYTSATATTKRQAVEIIVSNMHNTTIGKITSQNTIYRSKVIQGNSYEELKKIVQTDEVMFIDEDKLYIIKDTESKGNYIPTISAETGLLNVPRRENKVVSVSTILNPSIKLGEYVELISQYAPYLNGTYRVENSSYKGDYSGNDWIQDLQLRQKA